MISMMFYPLMRQRRGDGTVTSSECIDMLNEAQWMQDEINRLKGVVAEQRRGIEDMMDQQAAANAIGNIAHAEQEREEYDRAPHPEWEPKR